MHERYRGLAQAVEIELDLNHIPDDPVQVLGLLERIVASLTWSQLLLKVH
jgi:hypothetical protein